MVTMIPFLHVGFSRVSTSTKVLENDWSCHAESTSWSVMKRICSNELWDNDFPMMKMSYFNYVHWMTRLAHPRWLQKMKLSLMSMTSEFRLRSIRWKFRSVHDSSYKRGQFTKIQLTEGCMDDLIHFVEAWIVKVVVITSFSTVVFVNYFIFIQVTIIAFPVTSRTQVWFEYTTHVIWSWFLISRRTVMLRWPTW